MLSEVDWQGAAGSIRIEILLQQQMPKVPKERGRFNDSPRGDLGFPVIIIISLTLNLSLTSVN
jgi:hypothetical protein